LQAEELAAVADRGYFSSPQIQECAEAGIIVTLPKPLTSGAKSQGRFGKQDFVYVSEKDVYRCPAGEQLTYRFSAEEHGMTIRRYWTTACPKCPLQSRCTTGPMRRIPRWEHEHLLEVVQERLDANPQAMRMRRETVEHPFGTMKARMGATHFLTKTLPKVATEMALSVLAYNLTRVTNIVGTNRSSQRSGHSGVRRVTHWATAGPDVLTVALGRQWGLFASKIPKSRWPKSPATL
jgi:hypothetical protein